MSQDNAKLYRQFVEAANRAEFDRFDEFIAPDAVDHNPLPGQVPGLDGVKQSREMVKQGQETIHKADEALDTLKRGADAITKMPGIRSYVSESANALLYRPEADSDRGEAVKMVRAAMELQPVS